MHNIPGAQQRAAGPHQLYTSCRESWQDLGEFTRAEMQTISMYIDHCPTITHFLLRKISFPDLCKPDTATSLSPLWYNYIVVFLLFSVTLPLKYILFLGNVHKIWKWKKGDPISTCTPLTRSNHHYRTLVFILLDQILTST